MLTALEQAIVDLDIEYQTAIKDYYERRDALMAQALEELGPGHAFQAEDGVVFKLVKPSGTFTRFRDIDVVRTRRGYLGETKTGISKKEAEALGFNLGSSWAVVKGDTRSPQEE